MGDKAIAVVVARGGSTRLPGKALLPFNSTTLIGHKIDQLHRCALVGRVIVGSDSDAILDEARAHGAETIKRDDYHCDESRCSANEMIGDMAGRITGADNDVMVWAHPTNPLVRADTYDAAIRRYQLADCDSLVSVTEVRRHAWFDGKPINYHPHLPRHTPAAECRPIYFQDGAIFIQPLGRFQDTRYFFGSDPELFVIDGKEGWDIDTREDYQEALRLWGHGAG